MASAALEIETAVARTAPAHRPIAPPLPQTSRFVFILSPERSGSTLLSAMLGGHSRTVAPPELHMLRYESIGAWREAYPAAVVSLDALLEATGVDVGPIDDTMAPIELYRRIQRRAPADRLLVDKTPAYARRSESLRAAESLRPCYIWLVRHPLGVAASRVNRMWAQRPLENTAWMPWLKYPLWYLREGVRRATGVAARTFAEDWADVHGRIRWFLAGVDPDRVVSVHYEDLVRQPARQLQRICNLLDIEPEPAMLDPRGNAPKGLCWGVGDETVLKHAGVNAAVADTWRQGLSEDLLSARVRSLARELGVRLDCDAAPSLAGVADSDVSEEPLLQLG